MLSESTLIKTLTLILNLCLKLLPHDYALIEVFIQNLTCILIFFYLKIKIILYMYLCLRTESHVGFLLKHRLTSTNVFTMKLFLCLFVLWKFPIQRTHRARWKGLFTAVIIISDTKYTSGIWLHPVLILLSPFAPGKFSVFPSAVADMLSLTLRQRLQVSTFCFFKLRALISASGDPFSACKSSCK